MIRDMREGPRVAGCTAFLSVGVLVEATPTNVMFRKPAGRQRAEYVAGRFG